MPPPPRSRPTSETLLTAALQLIACDSIRLQIEFRDDTIQQHLLLADGINPHSVFLVTTLVVPDGEGGEALLMRNQVELIRIDTLYVGNPGVSD